MTINVMMMAVSAGVLIGNWQHSFSAGAATFVILMTIAFIKNTD